VVLSLLADRPTALACFYTCRPLFLPSLSPSPFFAHLSPGLLTYVGLHDERLPLATCCAQIGTFCFCDVSLSDILPIIKLCILLSLLLLDVHIGFGACLSENRTVQNRNRSFFPKTEPKLTDFRHCDTVTTLMYIKHTALLNIHVLFD